MNMHAIDMTKGELAAVLHRLALSDCLSECLSESHDFDADAVEQAANEMLLRAEEKKALLIDLDSEIERHIAIDCIEGSTWVGIAGHGWRRSQAEAAAFRTLTSAGAKIAAVLKVTIEIPVA